MFGYLVAAAGVLEDQERQRYQSLYCGLCRSLERCFGHPARLTLNYDMTFLVLLLGSLYEPEEEAAQRRCPRHPVEAQRYVCSEISDYAANMNLALAYLKCLDDWNDDKRLSALAEAKTLEPWYRAVQARYPRQCQAISQALDALAELEREGQEAPDAAAACFGDLMAELFACKHDIWEEPLRRMGFYMGKYIYLLDAYDDLEDDAESGSFNPLLPVRTRMREEGSDFDAYVRALLSMLMASCTRAFEALPIVENIDILRNILYAGVWTKFEVIFARRTGADAHTDTGPAEEAASRTESS